MIHTFIIYLSFFLYPCPTVQVRIISQKAAAQRFHRKRLLFFRPPSEALSNHDDPVLSTAAIARDDDDEEATAADVSVTEEIKDAVDAINRTSPVEAAAGDAAIAAAAAAESAAPSAAHDYACRDGGGDNTPSKMVPVEQILPGGGSAEPMEVEARDPLSDATSI